jgi:chemotaxis protein histidine kinase CheA
MSKPFTDGAKVRVYTLAKELGKTGKELLPVLQEMGYAIKSVQSTLTEDDANSVYTSLSAPKKSSRAKKSTSKKTTAKKTTTKKTTAKKTTSTKASEEEESTSSKKTTAKKTTKKTTARKTTSKKTTKTDAEETTEAVAEEKPKKTSRSRKKKTEGEEKPAKKKSTRKPRKKKEEAVEETVEEVAVAETVEVAEESAPVEAPKAEASTEDNKEAEFQAFSLNYLLEYLRLGQFDASAELGSLKTSGSEKRIKYTQTLLIHSREGQYIFGNSRSKIFFADLRHLMNKMCRQQFGVNVHFYFEIVVEGEAQEAKPAKPAKKAPQPPKTREAKAEAPKAEAAPQVEEAPISDEPVEDDDFTRAILHIARQAQKNNKAYVLSCMSPKDRHRVHSALASSGELGVKTVSDGEGIFRRLLIVPEGLTIRNRPNPQHQRR